MKHALAEEGRPQRDTIKTADDLAILPSLDSMDMAEFEELTVERSDPLIDPVLSRPTPAAAQPSITAAKS